MNDRISPASDPICGMNIGQEFRETNPENLLLVEDGNNLTARCYVYFRGNLIPRMEWMNHDGTNISEHVTYEVATNARVTSSLEIRALIGSTSDHVQYSCRVYFDAPEVSSDGTVNIAGNAPEYNFTWTSPKIKIFCKTPV